MSTEIVAHQQEQLALELFQEMFAADQSITEARREIGFNKANVLIDVSDLSMLSRRAVNAFHFIAACNPMHESNVFDVDQEYFKWLVNYGNSRNHAHLKKSLREAQKSAAMVSEIDLKDPSKDKWISVPLVGMTAIANGRVVFEVPLPIRKELANPDSYTYLSLRISNAFSSRYAMEMYEKLSKNRYKGGTDWMTIEFYKESLKISDVKTLAEFKNLRRYVIDPSVDQINELSDIYVTYETRAGGGTRKITHIRFKVEPNPKGRLNLRVNYSQQIADVYEALTKEFGLSEEQLDEIMENREEWTDARIQEAIEFTRYRIQQKKEPIKYPGLYLMNALRKNLVLAAHERAGADQKIALSKNRQDSDKAHQERSSAATKEGIALLMDAGVEAQEEIFNAFKRATVYKGMLKGIETVDEALANPRVKAALGAFAQQRLQKV